MRSDLPKQMNPMTTWIGADNSGRRSLLYTYQFNFTANEIGGSWSAFARQMGKNNQAGYCTDSLFFWYRDNDVAMEWRYLDKNREFAFQVKASLSDCDAWVLLASYLRLILEGHNRRLCSTLFHQRSLAWALWMSEKSDKPIRAIYNLTPLKTSAHAYI